MPKTITQLTAGTASDNSVIPADDPLGQTGKLTLFQLANYVVSAKAPTSGNATTTQLVRGSDTRLSDTRTPTDGSVTPAKLSQNFVIPAGTTFTGASLYSTDATSSVTVLGFGASSVQAFTTTNGTYCYLRPNGTAYLSASNNAGLYVKRYSGTGDIIRLYYGGSSVVTQVGSISTDGSTISVTGISDYRVKENVEDLASGLEVVNSTRVRTFSFTTDPTHSKRVGFIAHELQEVVPYAVVGDKDAVDDEGQPVMQQVDFSKLVPLLVRAVQELSAKVDALTNS